jgi:hypothetical protein
LTARTTQSGAARTGTADRAMTRDELLALPPAIPLETANRALGISRSNGYALAKRGQYPCRVLRLGNAYRVVTAELHTLLGVAPAPAEQRDAGQVRQLRVATHQPASQTRRAAA